MPWIGQVSGVWRRDERRSGSGADQFTHDVAACEEADQPALAHHRHARGSLLTMRDATSARGWSGDTHRTWRVMTSRTVRRASLPPTPTARSDRRPAWSAGDTSPSRSRMSSRSVSIPSSRSWSSTTGSAPMRDRTMSRAASRSGASARVTCGRSLISSRTVSCCGQRVLAQLGHRHADPGPSAARGPGRPARRWTGTARMRPPPGDTARRTVAGRRQEQHARALTLASASSRQSGRGAVPSATQSVAAASVRICSRKPRLPSRRDLLAAPRSSAGEACPGHHRRYRQRRGGRGGCAPPPRRSRLRDRRPCGPAGGNRRGSPRAPLDGGLAGPCQPPRGRHAGAEQAHDIGRPVADRDARFRRARGPSPPRCRWHRR